jgi:hypothetical protein
LPAGLTACTPWGRTKSSWGVLKRLRGTPIARHTQEHGMVYDSSAPYTVQQTAVVDAQAMQRFTRFARYWDLVANSGRFKQTLRLLLDEPVPRSTCKRFAPFTLCCVFGLCRFFVANQRQHQRLEPRTAGGRLV